MADQKSSRVERKREAQRVLLVAAARRVLARDGIGALTVEAVAAEADVSTPSVHYYFPGKDALAAAVVVDVGLEELAVFEGAVAGAESFRVAADRCLAAFSRRYRDDHASFRAHYVWSQVLRSRDPALEALPRRAGPLIAGLEALVRRDQEAGLLSADFAPRPLVNVVAAMCAGVFIRATLLEANAGRSLVDVEAVVREARAVLAHALAPPPEKGKRRAKR